jgi:tetratricopeptide (TPR) repeat protein
MFTNRRNLSQIKVGLLIPTLWLLGAVSTYSLAVSAQNSKLGQQISKELNKKQVKENSGETQSSKTQKKRKTYPAKKNSSNPTAKKELYPEKTVTKNNVQSLMVTFFVDVPAVRVYLNGKDIGTTDTKGMLKTILYSGQHKVAFIHSNYTTLNRDIDVKPTNTFFEFKLSVSKNSNSTSLKEVPAVNAASASPVIQSARLNVPEPRTEATPTSAILEEIDSLGKRLTDPQQVAPVSLKDWQQLLSITREGLTRQPYNAKLTAFELLAQGQISYMKGNYVDALDKYKSATNVLADLAYAYHGMGNAYHALNQRTEAMRSYNQALGIEPKLAITFHALGDLLNNQGNVDQALLKYQRAIALNYFTPSMGYSIANILRIRRDWDKALELLNSIPSAHQTPDTLILIGDIYLNKNKPISAIDNYRRATELDSNSAEAFFKLGHVLFKQHEYPKAIDALGRSLSLDYKGTIVNRKQAQQLIMDAKRKLNNDKE